LPGLVGAVGSNLQLRWAGRTNEDGANRLSPQLGEHSARATGRLLWVMWVKEDECQQARRYTDPNNGGSCAQASSQNC